MRSIPAASSFAARAFNARRRPAMRRRPVQDYRTVYVLLRRRRGDPHRRLDLDEAAFVEETPYAAHNGGAADENVDVFHYCRLTATHPSSSAKLSIFTVHWLSFR